MLNPSNKARKMRFFREAAVLVAAHFLQPAPSYVSSTLPKSAILRMTNAKIIPVRNFTYLALHKLLTFKPNKTLQNTRFVALYTARHTFVPLRNLRS